MLRKETSRACQACGCDHHGGHHGCGYKIERAWIECDGCECWSCRMFRKFRVFMVEIGLQRHYT